MLGNISNSQLPQIAETGLIEELHSESLAILAGLNEKDNAWEIESYFQSMLFELNYTLPSKLKAVKILLHYYLNKIISNPNKVYSLMKIINNDIYYQIDSEENHQIKKKKYVGEELGLEKLYTWYRELQDFEDESMLLYYNDLPRLEQKRKFEEHLI